MTGLSLQAGLTGFVLGLSFILSLGPQNLRLLEAGLTRSHVLTLASVGLASEAVLVLLGAAWLNTALSAAPGAALALQVLGVNFLIWCGLKAFTRRTLAPILLPSREREARRDAVASMLAVTWLNPLVYFEALFLVGLLASKYHEDRAWFAAGFLAASALKFYGWGFAGRLASPWLSGARRTMFDAAAGTLLWLAAALLALKLVQDHGSWACPRTCLSANEAGATLQGMFERPHQRLRKGRSDMERT